jgi:putative transposase
MHAYMSRILQTLECKSITIGGHTDHVHILCNLTKKSAPMSVIEILKKDSSKFAKRLSPDLAEFAWQTGYGFFGVSPSLFETVRKYVVSQEAHHRSESFQDEYRRLLVDAGIAFDERYVWD